MIKEIYILIFSLILSVQILAQAPVADFNLPLDVCKEEQFQLENTSSNADSYEWDFCIGDLSKNNLSVQSEAEGTLATPQGASFIEYNDNWYAFTANVNNNTITRLSFGNSLKNTPIITNLGNYGGKLSQPEDIKVVNDIDSIYLFVSNRTNNRFIRINLGTDINNTEPTSDIILSGNQDIFNNGIEVVFDGQSWIGFYTASNFIRLINFGSNLSKIPDPAQILQTSTISNINNIGDIEIIRENGTWYGNIIGYTSKTLIRLDFGSSLFSNPSATNITPPVLSSVQPYGIKLIQEVDSLYGFISTFNGSLIRLNYGLSLTNSPSVVNLGNFSGALNRTLKIDIAYDSSSFIGLTTNYSNNTLIFIEFPNICSSSTFFSKLENPLIYYSEAGNYKIGFKVTNSENKASTTKEIMVTANQAPEGTFALDSVYCIADNINFTFDTSDDISTYNWDFGDGNSSTDISPNHQYTSEGEYIISLAVESAAGCANVLYDTLRILPEPQPEFSTLDTEYCTFEAIDFSNDTPFNFGENVAWSWDFSGEGTSAVKNPNFTFETAGSKIIVLEANVLGCVVTYQDTLEIIDGPQPDFAYDRNCLDEAIQFTNLSTGANITGYQWDFGNGATSMEENPQTIYNSPGNYTVELRVNNASGCENTTSQNIQVFDQVVDSIMSTEAIENLPFKLGIDWRNDFDSTQSLTYQWDIGGEMQTGDTATYTLPLGVYTVNLEMITASNCIFMAQRTLEVRASEKPIVEFNLPSEVCLEEQFELDNSSNNAERYEWDFCTNDLATDSIQIRQTIDATNFDVPIGSSLIKFKGLWYAFMVNEGDNSIARLSFGGNFNNNPSITNLGNYGGQLDGPQDIKAIEFEDELLLFVSNRNTNKFIRINVGGDIDNVSPTADVLLTGNKDIFNNGVDVVFDGSNYVAVYTASNFLRLINLGNDPRNIPTEANKIRTSNISNITDIGDISFYKENSSWYAVIVGYTSRTIIRLNFGSSIFSNPSAQVIPNGGLGTSRPYSISILSEAKKVYGYISTASGNFFKMSFDESILNEPIFTNLGTFSVLNRNFKTDISSDKSRFFGISTDFNANKVYFIHFLQDCSVNLAFSEAQNPVNSYTQPGTYPITLTAYHPNGNSASITKEIMVTANQAPEGTFALDSVYCIADNINFTFDTSDDISTYNWDFGDGNSSTDISPNHQYTSEGEYIISLAVESAAGCANVLYDTLRILPEPQPEFSTLDTEYCTFEAIDFSNDTPFNFGENVVWSWAFNGEGSSSEENPSFIFERSGTKTITLEANVLGCVVRYQSTLEIIDGPAPDFEYNQNCINQAIQFTNLSTGANITGYEWDFGNGGSSTEENPQTVYANAGNYTVELKVSNSSGCQTVTTQSIRIFDQIVDSIYASEAIENLPFELGIDWVNDFDSTQNLTIQWEINEEIQTTETVTYTLGQGTYTVNLEITTASSCVFTTSRTIEVEPSVSPTPAFNIPFEVCLGEQFELGNHSINADRYEWDFCTNDLATDSLQINQIIDNENFDVPLGSSLIFFKGEWYGFVVNVGDNSITRLRFGDHFNNNPTIEKLGNYGGQLDEPQDIKALVFEEELLLFVSNRNTNKFIRINVGGDIENVSPTTDVLLTGGQDIFNNGIDVVFDGSNFVAVYTASNFLRLINLGNDPRNIPTEADKIRTSIISNVVDIGDISFYQENNNWYGVMVGYSSRTILRLTFGANIFSNPDSEVIPNGGLGSDRPYSVSILSEVGNVYGYISTASGNLYKLAFDQSILNDPIYTNLGTFSVLTRNFKTDISSDKSRFFGISTDYNANKVYFIDFLQDCSANLAFSEAQDPVNSYTQPGTYPITLTAYHTNGNSASITKEIIVTSNQAPEITFSAGESLCVSAPIQFASESNTEINSYAWDFGDGESSTEANPEHLFALEGQYLVQLFVTDTAGCKNLFQDSITVYAEPVPAFHTNSQGSICSQKPVVFENTTELPTMATFLWDFGDGNTSSEENPEHIYAAEGEYIVSLQIEMAGCLVEKMDTILVNPGPLVDFNYTDDCFGQVVNFENISTGDFLQSFQWNFGDGTQSTQLNPNHSYDSAGTYNVQLTAFTSNGCDYTFQKQVTVNPVATVAFESEVGCANQPLQFTELVALEQSNITDYLWEFGVSGTSSDISTVANPEFSFPAAGNYQVRLQVTTADGCTSSGTQNVTVNALPQPSFTYEENCLNNAILFSPENTENIIAHFWELQNESGEIVFTAQSENFSYAFENPGTYQLSYRQENENLCSNSITETVEILPLPEPDFQTGDICANEAVFIENLTELNGNTLRNYSWSIDGEEISTDFSPQYSFEESGEFLLGLEVETQNGCIQNIEKTISVSPSPTAFFELEQTLAAYPYTLNLNAEEYLVSSIEYQDEQATKMANRTIPTSPLGTEGLWTLNGDTISSSAQLNYVIEQPGTYLLGLIVTNEAGCTDSHYEQIRVREPSLDIALNNLRITRDQDFTGFVVNISNRGTLVADRLDLDIDLGSYSVTETVEEPLLPEKNRNIALSIKLSEEQLRGLAKICISAIPYSAAANERNVNNNRVCTNLESGLNIMEIYPNPVATKFTLPMIIPENASVNLSLEQANGQNVKTFSYDLEAGYHEIQIDRDNLKPGIYFLRIRYQGEEKVKKIIFQ